jgi:FkbM family methyltransferase
MALWRNLNQQSQSKPWANLGEPVRTVRLDQWLLDAAVHTPTGGWANRAKYRLLRGLRRLRLFVSDPAVSCSLGAYNLRLPLSHELPFYRRKFPDYGLNLGTVSFFARQKYPNLTMIDIGANIGDSLAIVHKYSDHPVLCLEGEPRFFQLLQENTRNLLGVESEQTFIGAPGDHVSSIHARNGNAQVLLGPTPSRASICTLSEALDRHPRFATAKFLKIDAEGFDCRIIAAETELLKRNRPILFFEYYPKCSELVGQKASLVFTTLSSLGYSVIVIYQNLGRYFMSLTLDQLNAIEDLHRFISDLEGYCDIVAFHRDDQDIAINLRATEYASRALNPSASNGHLRER